MSPKVKNIIIIAGVGVALVLVYVFFIRSSSSDTPALTSSSVPSSAPGPSGNTTTETSQLTQDFLSLLLNVKNIKLDETIFSDGAFSALTDSSITLLPDGTEGRPNPFAPIGSDVLTAPNSLLTPPLTPSSATPPMAPVVPPFKIPAKPPAQAPAQAPAKTN